MHRITNLALASLFSAVLLAGLPSTTYAHAPQDDKKITLEMQQADIREVLRALFKSANTSYSVAPDVQGLVTVSLKDIPFETALQNILKQVDATYRIIGGVYEVIHREQVIVSDDLAAPIETKAQTTMRRVYLRHADPQMVSMLMSKSGTDFASAPEQSTVNKLNGSGGNGGFGGSNFGGGTNGGNGDRRGGSNGDRRGGSNGDRRGGGSGNGSG